MDDELNSSCLGSYEFWDNVYSEEIQNFEDHGDVGEIWFGKDTENRVVKWIVENSNVQVNDDILDLGCGNGMLLVSLFKKGYRNLHGVDYSKNAIDLARAISESKQCCINFFVGNILEDIYQSSYTIVLDKGTYDAISLDPEDAKVKRQIYIKNINLIIKENGYFIITSCNWTEPELLNQFSDLEHIETLPAPTFQFGGKLGKTVTTLVFRKSLLQIILTLMLNGRKSSICELFRIFTKGPDTARCLQSGGCTRQPLKVSTVFQAAKRAVVEFIVAQLYRSNRFY